MKTIPLTQGQSTIVSDHWFDYLNQWKWHAKWVESVKGFYAVRVDNSQKKSYYMHRVVAKTPDGMLCDHIHHNTLDNREEELRNVTRPQSQANRKLNTKNKLGVTGVYKHHLGYGYRAVLYFKGKCLLDKIFKTFDDAVQSRKEAEKKHFGEFAYAGDK